MAGQASGNKNVIQKTVEFFGQVRQEVSRVTWPSRRETGMTTAFVFGFCVVAAIYLSIVDFFSYKLISFILGLGA